MAPRAVAKYASAVNASGTAHCIQRCADAGTE
jgi:hypothetical protein